jgi:predicted metal-dependent hydrolase
MSQDFPPALPPPFYFGLSQLNSGDYFVCHETLEALWLHERGGVRQLYQGVIQIAVGCFHLTERANWVGATRKLDEGARRIERTLPRLPGALSGYGVDWQALIADADRLQAHLREIGPDNIAAFNKGLLPHVRY